MSLCRAEIRLRLAACGILLACSGALAQVQFSDVTQAQVQFSDVTQAQGIVHPGHTEHVFFDFNNDGLLDLLTDT
ncbi:MAG: hypothetical protein GKR89_15400 [Candidatus Latescibacteria bacterium]|nr:hypothetical protein [Candidatus Latescibacterota bacterium]